MARHVSAPALSRPIAIGAAAAWATRSRRVLDKPSRAATLEVPETAYDRAQLVGCQPIVCSTAAMPDPIVDFDDEFLRRIQKHRVTYALTGRRLANFFSIKEINFALIHGARSEGAQVKVKATGASGNGYRSATRD